MLKPLFAALLFIPMTLASVGCGSSAPPACDLPEQTGLIIDGSDRLNPDETGRSLPTIVRIYQLKEVSKLEMASFEEVWRNGEEVLGDSVLGMDEVTLYPGRRIVRGFERNPEATSIAAVAIVRRPSGVSWRTIFDLPANVAATSCAAQQQDPDAPPPPPQMIRLHLFVEDYRIEGEMEQVPAPSGCTGSALECLSEGVENANDAAGDAANDVTNATQLPEVPQAPQMPQVPQAPQAPAAPTLP
jgi:type VI secretion system protein VasD